MEINLFNRFLYLFTRLYIRRPLGLWACGAALSTILPSSLSSLTITSTIIPDDTFYPSSLTRHLFPLPCGLEFHSPIFLFPRPSRVKCRREGWGSKSRISDGGGVGAPDRGPPGSLARRSYGPLGRPRPLRIDPRPPRSEPRAPKSDPRPPQDPPGTTQDRPREAQEPPRATQDHPKRSQERPKSSQERLREARISQNRCFSLCFSMIF